MIKQGVEWRRTPCCTTASIFSASLKDAAPSGPCCKDLVQLSQKLSLVLDCDCFVTAPQNVSETSNGINQQGSLNKPLCKM